MASEHEKTAGLLGGYTTRNSTAVAGIYFSYRFAPYYRVQPSIEYYFRKDGVDGFSFNIDNQFPIAIGAQKRCNFYPLDSPIPLIPVSFLLPRTKALIPVKTPHAAQTALA